MATDGQCDFALGRFQLVLQMEAATSVPELTRIDIEFHRTLTRAAGNPFLTSLVDKLENETIRARQWNLITGEGVAEAECDLEVSPTWLHFGTTKLNTTRPLYITLQNLGNADCVIDSYELQQRDLVDREHEESGWGLATGFDLRFAFLPMTAYMALAFVAPPLANLRAAGLNISYQFLAEPAGYDINQRLIEYDSQSTHWRMMRLDWRISSTRTR